MNKMMNAIFAIIIISMIFMMPVVFASAAENIQTKGITIINAILWIGYAIALGMVVYIGIKYMLGAADAKANMKNAIVGWLMGAFIVFMATTIVGWVLTTINGSPDTDSESEASKIVHALD